jgi:hypothetical protein
VQIKKEKIDHVSVKQAICQISQNPSKEKRERYLPPRIRSPVSHQQNRHNDHRDDGNYDEESVVALERSKRGAVIGDVNQIEEVRHYNPSIVRANGSQYPVLRQLVQSVERKREKEDELHVISRRAKSRNLRALIV